MSMLVRAAPLRAARAAAARQQVRYAHFENVVDKCVARCCVWLCVLTVSTHLISSFARSP